ncbi:MAG: hypothetical protein RJA90_1545, partial [Bacteroidota bacterium]
ARTITPDFKDGKGFLQTVYLRNY